MNTLNNELKTKIDDTLRNRGEIVIIAYSLLEKTEATIEYILTRTLKSYGKPDYIAPVLACIKELITNAIKANIKKILIDEGSIPNLDNPMNIIKAIKSVLNEKSLLAYGIKCKKYKLSSRIYIKLFEKKLIIKVINPIPLRKDESARIEDKIIRARTYDSLADFYMENPDPYAEGMGLGISMVVVLLKSLHIDYQNFKVYTDESNNTTATITIPF